ncbi:putative UDP-arabinopyranose mutase [Helianthus annuus]|nr:putative UDP-arabinopyranose mutase [Helianthus annuus]
MSPVSVIDNEVDILIGAFRSDLTSFMEEWRSIFSRFHLIVVKDPDVKEFKIPVGLMFPSQNILTTLNTPATPFFFNTLYDPYQKGSHFVRGYPFSLRSGVPCALSCGLWLNFADYDAPTQALKPDMRNTRYVDAVLTVPLKSMMPMSGVNIAFVRELVGPAMLPALKLVKEGEVRWETMEDVWCGLVVKRLKKEWEGVKLMEDAVLFVETLRLSPSSVTAVDCVLEIAVAVKERLGSTHAVFVSAAEAMVEWVKLWKAVQSLDH